MSRLMLAGAVAAILTGGMIGAAWGGMEAPNPAGTGDDPSLMGWWKLDDEGADVAPDSSIWGRHGTLYGNPWWVPGHIGEALRFDGYDDYVDTNYYENLPVWTVSAWVISPRAPTQGRVGGPVHREANYQFNWDHDNPQFRGTAALLIGDIWYPASFGSLFANQWYHLAATFDGSSLKAYVNGDLITTNTQAQGIPTWEPESLKIGRHAAGPWYFRGSVDEVRVYNRALTQGEIKEIALFDPRMAQNPRPAQNGNMGIQDVNAISWSAGQSAAMHDVYLGTDANAVAAADVNSPVYWGRQAETIFPVAAPMEIGARYFWRIDEVAADGITIHKGVVWSFTVSGYSIIDDFESYTDLDGLRIQESWIDGLVNGSGSRVDRWIAPSTTQRGGRGNKQAMSLAYDNGRSPFYSEVERKFVPEQDWTAGLADTLSLSVKGDMVSFGETAPGQYTLTASGADIWSNADECRYAFRRFDGDGSMSVRVDSFAAIEVWAKAGVMIRESLQPGSRHASMFVTPDGRRAFQNRPDDGSGVCLTAHSGPGAISLPHWIKLERRGNQFTAYHSADGIRWIKQPDDEDVVSYQSPNPQTIEMPATVYIGLALSSHNQGLVTTATFSGMKTTGYVSSEWQVAEIGWDHPGNSPDDLYVVVEDGEGKAATVVNPAAVNATSWTEWQIPFKDFPGVNFQRVKRISIGVGGRETSVPPGSGRIFIDDILALKP